MLKDTLEASKGFAVDEVDENVFTVLLRPACQAANKLFDDEELLDAVDDDEHDD